jgi:hypothetical protein
VSSQTVLTGLLLVLGAGFFVANTKLVLDYTRYLKRRSSALLIWPSPKPANYSLALAIGVALGILVFVKIFVLRMQAFGETMMFAYYAYLMPLSRRIGRGFYADGIWADSAFIPYSEVGGISWREGEHQVTLIVVSRLRNLARRLIVPGDKYGAARRLLRDKIGRHEIHFGGTGLDLGEHDERDEA